MAEFHLADLSNAMQRMTRILEEIAANLQDFRAALYSSGLPEVIVEDFESRRLMRQVDDDANVN